MQALPAVCMGASPSCILIPMKQHTTRILLIVAGWISIVLGAIGVVLPLLPTTPFILLAAACFARSSPRFHQWLQSHRHMGPVIRQYQQGKGISRTVLRRALIALWISLTVSMLIIGQWWSVLLLGAIGCATTVYLCKLANKRLP